MNARCHDLIGFRLLGLVGCSKHLFQVVQRMAVLLSILIAVALSPVSAKAEGLDASINSIAETLSIQLNRQNSRKLAIYRFSELNGHESALSDFISEELVTAFFQHGGFTVVERRELQRVLAENNQYASGDYDANEIAEVGQLLGADVVITGSITRLSQGRVRINARAVSVETRAVFAAVASTVDPSEDLRDLLSQAGSLLVSASSQDLVTQPSNVQFSRRGLQVIVTGVRRSDDGSQINVVTRFRNTSGNDIYFGRSTKIRDNFATTDFGTQLSLTLQGVTSDQYRMEANTHIPANGEITVVWSLRNRNGTEGRTVSMRQVFLLKSGSRGERLDIQLEGVLI